MKAAAAAAADDTSALYRARIRAEEVDRERLLAEQSRLKEFINGPDFTEETPWNPSSCANRVEGGTAGDAEHFVLLASFESQAPVAGVTVNAEGIVAAASWDGRVSLFDLPQWRDRGQLDLAKSKPPVSVTAPASASSAASSAFVAAAFAPTSPQVLGLVAGKGVQLWRVDDSVRECRTVLEHVSLLSDVDFHPGQGLMVSAGDDGQACLWDFDEQRVLRQLACGNSALSTCRFAGRSEFCQFGLATAGLDGAARLWDIRSPAQVSVWKGTDAAMCLDCHASSFLLAVGYSSGEIGTYDLRTSRELQRLPLRPRAGHRAYARSLAVSPCGSFLAAGAMDGELVVFDLHRRCGMFMAAQHHDAISSVAWGGGLDWAAAPHFLACGSLDGSWSCWGHSGRTLVEEC